MSIYFMQPGTLEDALQTPYLEEHTSSHLIFESPVGLWAFHVHEGRPSKRAFCFVFIFPEM